MNWLLDWFRVAIAAVIIYTLWFFVRHEEDDGGDR